MDGRYALTERGWHRRDQNVHRNNYILMMWIMAGPYKSGGKRIGNFGFTAAWLARRMKLSPNTVLGLLKRAKENGYVQEIRRGENPDYIPTWYIGD
jgi:DNA-binding MarR family transcriptional regulator